MNVNSGHTEDGGATIRVNLSSTIVEPVKCYDTSSYKEESLIKKEEEYGDVIKNYYTFIALQLDPSASILVEREEFRTSGRCVLTM
jgi:hypothetical protein